MTKIKRIKLVATVSGFLCCIFLSSCSSSSFVERFGKKDVKEKVRYETKAFENQNQQDSDYAPAGEQPFNTRAFVTRLSLDLIKDSKVTVKDRVLMQVIKYIDTPYRYGGDSMNGIDCSAFVKEVYKNSLEVNLPRTAHEQFGCGTTVPDSLKFGDLVFFDTQRGCFPGHVGIYLGENFFAHASTSQGVTVSSLKGEYYAKRFVGSRRIEAIN